MMTNTVATRQKRRNNNNNNSISYSFRLLVSLLFSSCFLVSPVYCEIRAFSGRINAASNYVHFSDGYLVSPGYVDLSDLLFTTISDSDDTDDTDSSSSSSSDNSTKSDSSVLTKSTIDVVFFHEPDECASSRSGCDWTKLGVGASNDDGLRWCCSNDAIDLDFCEADQYGRLIVNSTLFVGQHRFIPVPPKGQMKTNIKYGKLEEPDQSGKFVLVVANCNDEGRDVMVNGEYTWKSVHGYLPGVLFGEMYFFAFLTVVYFLLFCWYGISMKFYEDAIIPIQKWILATIGMGLLEIFFKTGDLYIWNEDGTRFWFALYTGVLLGVFKRAISRCLVLMVSLGWGVVRDDLGDQFKKIVALGIVYTGTSAARDITTLFAYNENEILSIEEEEELFDVVTILTFIVAAIDVTFYMWILDALNGTMQYLENMNQNMKLKRYLRLRLILLLSILIAVVWSVFGLVNQYLEEGLLEDENVWVITASWQVNYLFVLVAVAILWRPNPSAKEYAFVMELPSLGNDDDDDSPGNENAIPSAETAATEENGDEPSGSSYKDEPVGGTSNGDDKLKVENAVDA